MTRSRSRLLSRSMGEVQPRLSAVPRVPGDCLAYLQFLRPIPDEWQSRRQAERLGDGLDALPRLVEPAIPAHRSEVFDLCASQTAAARYLDSNPGAAGNRHPGRRRRAGAPPDKTTSSLPRCR